MTQPGWLGARSPRRPPIPGPTPGPSGGLGRSAVGPNRQPTVGALVMHRISSEAGRDVPGPAQPFGLRARLGCVTSAAAESLGCQPSSGTMARRSCRRDTKVASSRRPRRGTRPGGGRYGKKWPRSARTSAGRRKSCPLRRPKRWWPRAMVSTAASEHANGCPGRRGQGSAPLAGTLATSA